MRHVKFGLWVLARSLGALALFVLTGCASQPATAPVQERQLPVIDLEEKPAFPLPRHLESKDIAAGTIPHAQLFDDGAKLFHTPYNGLDGVGMMRTSPARRSTASRVDRRVAGTRSGSARSRAAAATVCRPAPASACLIRA